MRGHVLVLNQDYRALTICSVQRAVVLVHLQKAELVESLPDQFMRSPIYSFSLAQYSSAESVCARTLQTYHAF